jgi:2-oxoglutarate ferredoxin oxidoreductase subunit alpha
LAYGITGRAGRDAYNTLKKAGKPVSLLILKTLWPVPEELILEKAGPVNRVVVVEMNLGQYVREIERILPDKKIDFLGRMDGKLITPGQIEEVVSNV